MDEQALFKANQEIETILQQPNFRADLRQIVLEILTKQKMGQQVDDEIKSLHEFTEKIYNKLGGDYPKEQIKRAVTSRIESRFSRIWREVVSATLDEVRSNPQRVDIIWERRNEIEKIIEELTSPPYTSY